MDQFLGSWVLESTENAGPILDAYNVSDEKREEYKTNEYRITITKDSDNWMMSTHFMGKTRDIKFELGKETTGKTEQGDGYKMTIELKGDKMVGTSTYNGVESTFERWIEDGEMVAKTTVGNDTMTQRFKQN